MGCASLNKEEKNNKKDQLDVGMFVHKQEKLNKQWKCPNCMAIFRRGSGLTQFQQHISSCITNSDDNPDIKFGQSQLFKNASGVSSRIKDIKSYKKANQYIYEKVLNFKIKVADDGSNTKFNWSRVQSKIKVQSNLTATPQQGNIKQTNFQQKLKNFIANVENYRINWHEGCEWLEIDRKNVLMSSISILKYIDLHKQLKIKFIGQRANDAGGLLREWVHLINKQIFNSQLNIFTRAQTDEVTYKLRPCNQVDTQFAKEILYLYGRVLGKSLFEKIPMTTYLDRTILRYLTGKQIQLSDVFSYDKNLYNSWSYILNNTISSTPNPNSNQIPANQFNYTVMVVDSATGKVQDKQLIENGSNIYVNQQNKKDYISRSLSFFCVSQVQQFLKSMKSGFTSVIPLKLISMFDPHELQMMLYGVPFIDVDEWELNTQYAGAYTTHHKTIIWYWQFMREQSQQRLSKLLHFCTGSSRTPINGFRKLYTNRGEYNQFKIQSLPYDPRDPYPKGHTCFNRLELPVYPTKILLQKYMNFILDSEFEGVYGLD